MAEAGYDDLTPAQVGVFRYPGPDGYRPSEIATNLEVTKQSVNDLLGEVERKGYVTREADPRTAARASCTSRPRVSDCSG